MLVYFNWFFKTAKEISSETSRRLLLTIPLQFDQSTLESEIEKFIADDNFKQSIDLKPLNNLLEMFVLEETIEQVQNLQSLYNFILSRLIEETTEPENLIDFVENNQAASLGKG